MTTDDLSGQTSTALKARLDHLLRKIDTTFRDLGPLLKEYGILRAEIDSIVSVLKSRGEISEADAKERSGAL